MSENSANPLKDPLTRQLFEGITAEEKSIPSWYFYDDHGSRLFKKITQMPEYYLTRCETEILKNKGADMIGRFMDGADDVKLVELGAGDGIKTTLIIEHLLQSGYTPQYCPIDISDLALTKLQQSFEVLYPNLVVNPLCAEYHEGMKMIGRQENDREVILFLGSNIGNMPYEEAAGFLHELRSNLVTGDILIVGFDLLKDPEVLINAYDDGDGITKAFNMNLLDRFNREFQADFRLDQFEHMPVLDLTGSAMKSFLMSTCKQTVSIRNWDLKVDFSEGEMIFTEVSNKFSEDQIKQLAKETGFSILHNYYDQNKYFIDSLLQAK